MPHVLVRVRAESRAASHRCDDGASILAALRCGTRIDAADDVPLNLGPQ